MFKKFMAVLILYHHNCRILHWKIKDVNFDEYHELAANYYGKIQEDLDKIVEIALIYNENPIELTESYGILYKIEDEEYKVVDPIEDYSAKDFQENISIMFKDIMMCIKQLLEEDEINNNPGARSELETMYSYYDIECNYKNVRRV